MTDRDERVEAAARAMKHAVMRPGETPNECLARVALAAADAVAEDQRIRALTEEEFNSHFRPADAVQDREPVTAETLICCDHATIANPSCGLNGDGVATLGELIANYDSPGADAVPDREPDGDVMPVFAIKAKDNLALIAVQAYRTACEEEGLHDQALEVGKAFEEILSWRERNPGACKWPDHRHAQAGSPGSGSGADVVSQEDRYSRASRAVTEAKAERDQLREARDRAREELEVDSEWAAPQLLDAIQRALEVLAGVAAPKENH